MGSRPSKSSSERLEPWSGGPSWLSGAVLGLVALAFALFVRVTLYGRVEIMEPGPKGIIIPAALLLALVAWHGVARGLISRSAARATGSAGWLAALTFVPMLATLPISLQVLLSDDFAREYWIDRSLKVELLLGLPALALALQAGIWTWFRFRLTWRGAGPMLVVLAAALGLRWAGMGWGLPFAFQPEESSIYVRWAIEFALHGQWNPHYFQNPSLLIYLLGIEFSGIFALARILQFGQDPGDLYMVFRGEQDLFYGLARLNSVLLGTATVFVVYLIGRRLWGERPGIVSAAFLAVNFLHVRNSQYAVNDVPSTFFLVLSFCFALDIAKRGSWRDYLLAGLMAGLAASTKYNAGMAVVPIVVAHWLRRGAQQAGGAGPGRGGMPGVAVWRESVAARRWWPSPEDTRLLSAALAAALGFVLGTPFSILDFNGFRQGFLEQLEMGSSAWSGQALEPTAMQFLAGVVHGSGVLVSLLALLGAASLLGRRRPEGLLLLSFPLPYFLFMSSMALFFVRWVVPVMPFIALAAGYAIQEVGKAFSSRQLSWLPTALVALAMLQPVVFSLRLDWLANQVDTRQEANRWAEMAIPPGSKVAVEAFSLLDQESLAFRATLQHREIELDWRATMHDLDYYKSNGFDYLAVSSFMYDRAFEQPEKYADRVEFYQRLDRECPLVAVFSPRNDGTPAPYALDDLDTPFWHLFAYDRPGPAVKVYRIGSR